MGAQMQRGAYSRVCGAATAKAPSCAGLCGGRTRSSRSFASLRMTKWSLDPVGVGAGFGRSGGQGAQLFDDGADDRLQRTLLVDVRDAGRTGGQLNAVVVLAIREPF